MFNQSFEARSLHTEFNAFFAAARRELDKVGTGERIYGELIGTHMANLRRELLEYWQGADSYITDANWVGEDHFIRLGGREGHLHTILDWQDTEDGCGKVIINVKVATECIRKGHVSYDDIMDHLDGIK